MIEIATWLLLAPAVWRLTSILHREEGPFRIAQIVRNIVGVKYDDFSEPYGKNVVSEAFSCMWCLSVWTALFLLISVVYLSDVLAALIVIPFGLSALTIFIEEKFNKG